MGNYGWAIMTLRAGSNIEAQRQSQGCHPAQTPVGNIHTEVCTNITFRNCVMPNLGNHTQQPPVPLS